MNITKLKDGKNLRINSMKSSEFFALLKIQIPILLVFLNQKTGKFIDTKYRLTERILDGNEAKVIVNGNKTSYGTLIKELSELQSQGFLMMVEVNQNDFRIKAPLTNLISQIKDTIVKSCVYLDYKDGMFSIIYKDFPGGKHSRLYYFEDTNSLLGFTEQGPMLVSDTTKINSIEDLIC